MKSLSDRIRWNKSSQMKKAVITHSRKVQTRTRRRGIREENEGVLNIDRNAAPVDDFDTKFCS